MKNGEMPARPIITYYDDCGTTQSEMHSEGLTKREHFAGLAMQGVLADCHIMNEIRCDDDLDTAEFVAGLAVEYADALLSALEGDE